MIPLVEGAERQKTPNEIALNVLLAGLTLIFLSGGRDDPELRELCRREHSDRRAGRAVRRADPDDDRCAAVGHRHRRHGSAGALQRARDVRAARSRPPATSTRCCSTRPARSRSATARRRSSCRCAASARRSSPTRRSSPRSPTRRRKAARSSCWPRRSTASAAARSASLMPGSSRSRRRAA